ncbi:MULTISPECIES: ribbon-helix-helix domain-containing protein [unclassified Aminobacter]|uniref:ribbon-helix-helix domain-containing protein n=1 Tax=unclassified Aminobacter TaxID=2644704 RepID=UPI000467B843|nr:MULTISPECIES: ribbon-helix-helix domain-containing protein [unclassified Aminobacter]TWG49636.1 ribbon-helix-helix protein [Aminobacter sp. J44]TWH24430.1 ribbon-helix-helix protein [Aminobacter sp. J15]
MSTVEKRSISIRGHRTSFSLEKPFFDELSRIAAERGLSVAALVAEVDETRPRDTNLSSALRVFVLEEVKRGTR